MKKGIKLLILVLCIALGLCAFAACGGKDPGGDPVPDGKVRVRFVDGTSEISHVDIDEGTTVSRPTTDPTKAGYDFVDWYATPNYTVAFDFSAPIDENTTVYAGFRSTAADNHTWYISGDFKAADLAEASVGYWEVYDNIASAPSAVTFTRDPNQPNKYTLEVYLYKGDEFKIANNECQGTLTGALGPEKLIAEQYSTDDTSPIYAKVNYLGEGNIACGQKGKYKITLIADGENTGANKNQFTRWSYERTGDAPALETTYNFYIKGSSVSNWLDTMNDYTKLDTTDFVTYTKTLGMKQNDLFMFISLTTDGENTKGDWNSSKITLADNADTTALLAVDYGNIKVIGESGTYELTLTYDKATSGMTLAAERTVATFPEYDYYIKGDAVEGGWDTPQKITPESGVISYSAAMQANKQFMLMAVVKDGDPTAFNTDVVFNLNTSHQNLKATSNQIDISGSNFKTLAADTFTVTVDPFSMSVTVVGENDVITWRSSIYGSLTGGGWVDGAYCDIAADSATLTGSFTVEIPVNAAFGFRTLQNGQSVAQVGYAGKGDVGTKITLPATGFDTTGYDIKCTAAGSYNVSMTITAEGQIVSVVVTAAE